MPITCQVCGASNHDANMYCDSCGVELTPATEEAKTAVDSATASTPASAAPASSTTSIDMNLSPEGTAPFFPLDRHGNPAAPADATAPESTAPESTVPAATETATPIPVEITTTSSAVTAPEVSTSQTAEPIAAPITAPAATPATAGSTAKLGIKKFGAATGEFIPLQGERLIVGRFDASSGPVDIDLAGLAGNEHISRRHAELYLQNGVWYVRDLGSTNGVFVKRAAESAFSPRLQEPTSLANGDELAFGNLMLTFHQG